MNAASQSFRFKFCNAELDAPSALRAAHMLLVIENAIDDSITTLVRCACFCSDGMLASLLSYIYTVGSLPLDKNAQLSYLISSGPEALFS